MNLLSAACISSGPARECSLHERILEGSEIEDAHRYGPRHSKNGGLRTLWGLPVHHQALAQKKVPNRRRRDDEDPWQTLGEGQGLEGVAAISTGGESRPDPKGASRGVRG